MPCENVLQPDERKLDFQWKSKKTIYSLIFLAMGSIESIVGVRRLIRLGFNIHFVESLLFFITAMIKAILMFHLGRKWKEIMIKWKNFESTFLQSPYEKHDGWRLKTKLRVVGVIILCFVLGNMRIYKFKAKIYLSAT